MDKQLVERSFEDDLDATIHSLTGLSLCSSRRNLSLDESRVGTSNGFLDMDMPSFQGRVQDHTNSSMALENSILKEQVRTLERDNAILKQGVLILYGRQKQLEENAQELVQLRESMRQSEEKLKKLELLGRSFKGDLDAVIQNLTGLSLCSLRRNLSLDESRVGTSNEALDMPSFQGSVQDHTNSSMALENSKLKRHVRTLERDNAIIKRGVLILSRRHKQLDENAQELVQLREIMDQNEEKLKQLEIRCIR